MYGLTATGKVVPTEAVQKALVSSGISLSGHDLPVAAEMYASMATFAKDAGVSQTPSVIIMNNATGAKEVLAGADKITRERLLKAVGVEDVRK